MGDLGSCIGWGVAVGLEAELGLSGCVVLTDLVYQPLQLLFNRLFFNLELNWVVTLIV